MTQRDEGPTQGTHTEDPHRGGPQRGPAQGTHTGDQHRGEGPTEDPPPEGRATQGTHTEHTQTRPHSEKSLDTVCEGTWCRDNAPDRVFD